MTITLENAQHSLPDLIARTSQGERVLITQGQQPVAELRWLNPAPVMKTVGVVGGDACIRTTRIPVWTLVRLKKLGRPEEDLLTDFPGLAPADLDAAWDYYRAHTAEIDDAIAAEDADD